MCESVGYLLRRSKQYAAVSGDAVDGALVSPEFSERTQRVRVPELQHTTSTAAQQGRRTWYDAQRAHPVPMSVRDLLLKHNAYKQTLHYSNPIRALIQKEQ